MKKMKTKLYRCLLVCFMLCLGMGAFCVHANAEKKTGFTVKVKSGLDGKVQANTPFQVSITATSDKNFKGSVRVTPAAYEDYYSVVSASTDITLAAGESKTVNVTCAGMENSYYRVELLNEAGEVVHTQKEKLEILIEDKMLVGILSDDEGAISYIDNTLVKENEQEKYIGIVSLEADSFPVESCNLLSLSVIVVDNYDMSKLSDEQMDSLEKWIRKGGKLILSLGANYQNVLQGCDQRFGIETNGEVTNENFVSESEIEYQLQEVPCLSFSMEGAKTLGVDICDAQFSYKEYGQGAIAVFPYSLGMKPIAQSDEGIILWYQTIQEMLNHSKMNLTNYMDNGSFYSLADIADQSENKPSALLYAIILLVYILMVGPGVYVLFKKWKKREKIWIVMPVVALVFVGVIYVTGLLYRIKEPIMNNVTMLLLSEDAQSENVYSKIICPKVGHYEIPIQKEYEEKAMCRYRYYYTYPSTNRETDYNKKINGDQAQLEVDNVKAFDNQVYVGIRATDNTTGLLDYNLVCTPYEFSGELTNHTEYDLRNVVVLFEDHFYMLERLNKGETVSLDESNICQWKDYNTFYDMYSGWSSPKKQADEQRARSINEAMQTMVSDNMLTELNKGIIWAEAVGYTSELPADDKIQSHDIGIVVQQFEEEYQSDDGCIYSMLDKYEENAEGNYSLYGRTLEDDDMLVTYSLEQADRIVELQNLSMHEQNNTEEADQEDTNQELAEDIYGFGQETYAKVYGYNVKTGSYDLLFEDNDILDKKTLKTYIKEGKLQLKYVITENPDGLYGTIPKIIVKEEK